MNNSDALSSVEHSEIVDSIRAYSFIVAVDEF